MHPYPILEIPSSNKPAASPSISGYWTVRSLSSLLLDIIMTSQQERIHTGMLSRENER